MAAVIVLKGKIIGRGFNLLKTCPGSPHPYRSTHAEYSAFLDANGNIEGATVYVFRETKNGVTAPAKPCTSCFDFLVGKGVKKIVYTIENSYKEEKVA
jgi:pyrimidine deaminase RibD-like protein